MASTYKKGNKIYISWYDPLRGKTYNKSTGLDFSKPNMKEAKRFAANFQKNLDEEVEKTKIMISTKNETVSMNLKKIDQIQEQIAELSKLRFDENEIQRIESYIKLEKEKKIKQTATYTIQLFALKHPVELSYFKNLQGVERKKDNDGFYRYTIGKYKGYKIAKQECDKIINKGYKDAFIVKK